jgi:hypothetical protein
VDNLDQIHVVDASSSRVQRFTPIGGFVDQWPLQASGAAEDVWVDGLSSVFVSDLRNSAVQKFAELPVTARSASWGEVKALYVGERPRP